MPEENLASGQTLEDLSEGSLFDENELVIENNGRSMTTVMETPDEEELRTFCYDLVVKEGIVQSIRYNGGQEYYPQDEEYSGLISSIKEASREQQFLKTQKK